MARARTDDGIELYYEEAGEGSPIVFVHEFAGDHLAWEPQIRFFARRHRCVVYAARGYPPSDVPGDVEAYSQKRAAADIACVMDASGIDRAHVVGLSMGAFATLHLGLDRSERARSLTVAGIGYGAEKSMEATFRELSELTAQGFENDGSEAFAETYAVGSARVQFQNKDPRGWQAFKDRLAGHDPKGAANTMRGVQARRPSLYDLEAQLKRLQLPTLIVAGDEDDHSLQPSLFLKRTIPASGLLIVPKCGHTINLEEPEVFNSALAEFLAMVEADAWKPRDPRARPEDFMGARR
ncbi:MAG: alpha/beta hydrolase [Geminicoccaceae bacterium]|nr:alpha/beta hydrolase [Geminicoccaceae bacterium]